jgi:hypothetical protein
MLENTPRKIKRTYNSGEVEAINGPQTVMPVGDPNSILGPQNHTTRRGHD